ncbi:MAG: ThiF family adenylyltransferase [Planctomycetota bacterium]|jgi:molybdopterin/thiamine biosynthesis adenylyltransferase
MTSTTDRSPTRIADVTLRNGPKARAVPGARMPALHDAGPDPLGVLARLSVVVVGCGSVGGRIALHCARMGVGRLLLVDPDRFGPESLVTHAAAPLDVGAPKAARTAARAKALAPGARVSVFDGPVEALDPLELLHADVLLVATDNVPAELSAAQLALRLGIPLLHAALHGETLTAQVRVTGVAREDAACLACLMGPAELDELARHTRYACAGSGGGPARAVAPPTMSVSALCGLAADLAVLELLRLVLGLGARTGDAIVEQNVYARRTTVSPVRRRATCTLDHRAWERASSLYAPEQATPRALAASAGLDATTGRLALSVAGREWIGRAVCGCGATSPVGRLRARDANPGRCARCGERLHVPAVDRHRRVPGEALARLVDRPLARFGAGRPGAVLLESNGRSVVLQAAPRDATAFGTGP